MIIDEFIRVNYKKNQFISMHSTLNGVLIAMFKLICHRKKKNSVIFSHLESILRPVPAGFRLKILCHRSIRVKEISIFKVNLVSGSYQ